MTTKKEVVPNVLLLPLTAFNSDCRRIGVGGGFYDRTLAKMMSEGHQFLTIGLAFETMKISKLRKLEGLKVDWKPTDVPLDYVVTEKKVYSSNLRDSYKPVFK